MTPKDSDPTPRIGHLKYIDDILTEARRVFRAGRRGDIETQDMSRFIAALQTIAGLIRDHSFEQRLAKLQEEHGVI